MMKILLIFFLIQCTGKNIQNLNYKNKGLEDLCRWANEIQALNIKQRITTIIQYIYSIKTPVNILDPRGIILGGKPSLNDLENACLNINLSDNIYRTSYSQSIAQHLTEEYNSVNIDIKNNEQEILKVEENIREINYIISMSKKLKNELTNLKKPLEEAKKHYSVKHSYMKNSSQNFELKSVKDIIKEIKKALGNINEIDVILPDGTLTPFYKHTFSCNSEKSIEINEANIDSEDITKIISEKIINAETTIINKEIGKLDSEVKTLEEKFKKLSRDKEDFNNSNLNLTTYCNLINDIISKLQ